MNAARWMQSPLAGTLGVFLGMALLAIPLRKLTSAAPAPVPTAEAKSATLDEIPAVLRLRLLSPANHLVIQTADGKILLDANDLSSGESEHDATIPFHDGSLDLTLQASFGDSQPETAVFLTLMPDGYDEQTRYAIGASQIDEPLSFEWKNH